MDGKYCFSSKRHKQVIRKINNKETKNRLFITGNLTYKLTATTVFSSIVLHYLGV
jgi:hypothetical protein